MGMEYTITLVIHLHFLSFDAWPSCTVRPPPNYASPATLATTTKYSTIHSPIRPRKMSQHHLTVVGNGAMFGPYSTPYASAAGAFPTSPIL